ncbi:GA module-containing protein [Mycoplasma phocoeninasale]|uniref:GA module-containing protein n=1 Tax=Mycoplasma phocoeninasale TaxID=2726117 RepID=UPI0019670DA6|nr:GA module-containing protein [Mycoplasma phocoeninasale]MBN0970517.1 GA module-containing protein [Mycoplasma phocoeninasale]
MKKKNIKWLAILPLTIATVPLVALSCKKEDPKLTEAKNNAIKVIETIPGLSAEKKAEIKKQIQAIKTEEDVKGLISKLLKIAQ